MKKERGATNNSAAGAYQRCLAVLLLLLLLMQPLTRKKPKKWTQQQQAATRIGCSDGDVDSVAGGVVGTAGKVAASCHRHLFDASGSGTVRGDRHHCRWSGPAHPPPRTEQRSRLWPPRTESNVDGVVEEEDDFGDFVVVVAKVDGTPRGTERWPPTSSAGSRTPRNRPTRTLPKTRSIGGAGDDRIGIAVAGAAVWVCRHLLPQPQECHRQVAAW